jgi:HAD superfamily hydrolase (TIGR01509 family)
MNWGAIFDWDGVIIDSSHLHRRSWELLAHEIGRALPPDHFLRGFGMTNETILMELLGWTRALEVARQWSLRKEEIFRDLVRQNSIQSLPGVERWLGELSRAGVPRIIASSTHRANIEMILQRLRLPPFAGIVSAEDVTRGKPAPDIFLEAARRLGLPPQRCVVFEDSPAGIQAGRAAGMFVVAVTTTHPAASLPPADWVVGRLDELRVTDLEARLTQFPRPAASQSI